jgi:acyl dehydratase
MVIDPTAVGKEFGPVPVSWTPTDALLYALGVGCTSHDLAFCTENSHDLAQRVLPTFALVLGQQGDPDRITPAIGVSAMSAVGSYDPKMVVHGTSTLALPGPLPAAGEVDAYTRIAAIWDKGSAAIVELETEGRDRHTGAVRYTTGAGVFIRGAGGFGGARGPAGAADALPDRPPDAVVHYETGAEQALLYRLSGDRNPLHSDPVFAQRAGFERPILHGLCTFGFAGRALVDVVCDGDPARFRSMRGRFASPVYPGDTISVRIWIDGNEARFRTERADGPVAIDVGRCSFASSEPSRA